MHNYQLNIRSCHDRDCDYGRQSLTLAMQNYCTWTSFPQISIEMGWEMGNIFGMYRCYSPALVDPCWEKLPEVLSTTLGRGRYSDRGHTFSQYGSTKAGEKHFYFFPTDI